MTFKLSERSLAKLEGVKPELVDVVLEAIEITKIDFGVIQGLRTVEDRKNWWLKAQARPCSLST